MSERRFKQYRQYVAEARYDLIRRGYRGGKLDRAIAAMFPRHNRRHAIRAIERVRSLK